MEETTTKRPFSTAEREALGALVRAARYFSAMAAEFTVDGADEIEDPLRRLDVALQHFGRVSAKEQGQEIPSQVEQLEADLDALHKQFAELGDSMRAFLVLASKETPGLSELALATLQKTQFQEGTRTATLAQHWAAQSLAYDLTRSLGDAPNYLTLSFTHPKAGDIEVTVRRAEGKTPAQAIREMNERNDALAEDLAAAREHLAERRDELSETEKHLADARDQLAAAEADARAAEAENARLRTEVSNLGWRLNPEPGH